MLIAARLFCSVHIADQIQRLLIPLGPTTEDHHRPIGITGKLHLLQCDEGAWLATRPQGIEAEGRARSGCRRAQGRAAHVGPARLVQRGLQRRPVELAVPQKDHRGPRWDHLAYQRDPGDVEFLGTMPLEAVAHAPAAERDPYR